MSYTDGRVVAKARGGANELFFFSSRTSVPSHIFLRCFRTNGQNLFGLWLVMPESAGCLAIAFDPHRCTLCIRLHSVGRSSNSIVVSLYTLGYGGGVAFVDDKTWCNRARPIVHRGAKTMVFVQS